MLQKIVPEKYHSKLYRIKQALWGKLYHKSYSQEGEDMVLLRILGKKQSGFYVDIGAHHPVRFSNTYYFYQKGWRGINIDAMPGSMQPFTAKRPNDINLEVAIAEKEQDLTFYIFEEPAINSFDVKLSEERIKNGNRLIQKKNIKTQALFQVLDKHLPQGQKIDFLTIDVEGLDLMILKSNNWNKYAPQVVAVECLNLDLSSPQKDEVYAYMINLGYKLIAKTVNTCFFIKNDNL